MKPLINKLVVITIIFLIHLFSQAIESIQATDVFQLIEQINQSNFGYNPSCLNCSFHSETEEDIFQECAISLCGPSKKHPVFALNNATFDDNTNQESLAVFREQAEPLVRKKLEQEKANRSQVIDSLRSALDNPKTGLSSLKNPALNTLTNKILENGISEWRQLENHTSIVEWSIEVSENDFTVLANTNLPPDMSPEFKKSLNSYLQARKKEIESSAYTVTGKIPYKDTPAVLKTIWERLMNQYKKEKSKDGSFMQDYHEEIHNIDKEINQLDKTKVFNLSKKVDIIQEQFKKNKGQQAQHPICEGTQKEMCQQIIRGYLLKQYQKYQEVDIEGSIEYCQSHFMISPSSNQNTQKLQKMWPNIVQKVHNMLVDYSQESKSKFMDYIQNSLSIHYKENPRDDFLNKIKSYSNTKPSPIPIRSETFTNNPENNFIPPAFISANLPNTFNSSDLCSANLLQQNTKITESLRVKDKKRWETIHMSTFSCAFHHYGKQALAHEIGHALSNAFKAGELSVKSYNKHKKLRECATKHYKKSDTPNQSYQLKKKQTHQNDRFKTEEDTADLISYIIFNDELVLQSCYFLQPAKDGIKYNALEMFNIDEEDTHSAPFLRLLMEAIHKRTKLSLACQQVIDKYKDRVNFEPCF